MTLSKLRTLEAGFRYEVDTLAVKGPPPVLICERRSRFLNSSCALDRPKFSRKRNSKMSNAHTLRYESQSHGNIHRSVFEPGPSLSSRVSSLKSKAQMPRSPAMFLKINSSTGNPLSLIVLRNGVADSTKCEAI